jgi:hypothetical protein
MAEYNTQFEQRPDSGRLMASATKLHEKSPDYFGEIAIDLDNHVAVKVENGLHIFKLGGWKKKTKNGATYLALSVNRYVPEGTVAPKREESEDDADVPF